MGKGCTKRRIRVSDRFYMKARPPSEWFNMVLIEIFKH